MKFIVKGLSFYQASLPTQAPARRWIRNSVFIAPNRKLELGKGFLFEARQKRFTFDEDHFFVDLVFCSRLLRCYVLIDLKLDKLSHQDLSQMQMYVNYFDRPRRRTHRKSLTHANSHGPAIDDGFFLHIISTIPCYNPVEPTLRSCVYAAD